MKQDDSANRGGALSLLLLCVSLITLESLSWNQKIMIPNVQKD